VASSGASFANIANITTSLLSLPPSLQSYLDTSFSRLTAALAGPADYLRHAGVSPAVAIGTLGAVLLLAALPTAVAKLRPTGKAEKKAKRRRNKRKNKMPRYGWSSGHEREQLSPFNTTLGHGGVPDVTEHDYEYITSEDLQNQGVDSQHAYDYDPRASGHHFDRSAPSPVLEIPDDDKLKFRRGTETITEHFPAYAIGDGKLLVGDVRDRIQLVMKLSDKRTERVKMLYKGKQLKGDNEPICRFGVKNNSEIMVVLPEGSMDDSSDSSEEIVVVGPEESADRRRQGRAGGNRNDRSPRGSGVSVGLDVPRTSDDRKRGSTSRGQSPASGVSVASASSAAPGSPLDKLNTIASHFTTKLLPLCVQFTASPPSDPKKREDEHRKLSETVMQQVILKLDAVETIGDEQARARRKELVKQVQEVLKGLDAIVPGKQSSI